MSKNVDFEIGTVVTDTFLDSVQELLTGTIQNARLSETGTGTDRIALALSGDTMFDKRGSVNLEGRYCFFDVMKDSTPASSGNGERNVYLSTTANGTPQQPEFNITVDIAPPASSYVKRVGIVDKNGAILSNARMITGVQADHEQYNHFTFSSVYNLPNEVLLTLRGQDNQLSAAGAYKSSPSTAPTKAISVGDEPVSGTFTENFYIDTKGRLVWKDTTAGNQYDAVLQWGAGDADSVNSSVLMTNRMFSVQRNDGLNAAVVDDPTLDDASTITRNQGYSALAVRGDDTDTGDRFRVTSTGVLMWGDAAGAYDVAMYRPKANALALYNGDKFYLDYTIVKATDADKLAVNKEYLDDEVAAAISESKRFAFFITP